MATQVEYGQEAREDLLDGLDRLADAVKVTMGPRGRTVVLDGSFGSPEITKDGVTVADEVDAPEEVQDQGAQLVSEVTDETQDETGDGTTTAAVLAQALAHAGRRHLAAGHNAQTIRRGILEAAQLAVDRLRDYARDVEGDEVQEVATIAANNDESIGELLARAMEAAGEDGVITIEEGTGIEHSLDVVEGMQFDRGYKSPYFTTDDERMVAELDEPLILLYDDEISAVDDIVDLLEDVAREGEDLLIVAEDVDGEALSTLVVNKVRGQLDVAAVKAPGFGDRRQKNLEDLAVLTGGELISEEKGMDLSSARLSQLGRADRVTVTEDDTTIVGGQGDAGELEDRVDQIRRQMENTDSSYDREKLEERLANLAGGVAVVSIGAATEPEMEEIQARAEDALQATEAAVEEGIVPGGGVALLNVLDDLEDESLEGELDVGLSILREALSAPARQIADNAGEEGSVIVRRIREQDDPHVGFDARQLEVRDLMEAGIIDPVKVTRAALENAASVVAMLLTTEASVVEMPEDEEDGTGADGEGPPGGPGGGGMPAGGGMPGM